VFTFTLLDVQETKQRICFSGSLPWLPVISIPGWTSTLSHVPQLRMFAPAVVFLVALGSAKRAESVSPLSVSWLALILHPHIQSTSQCFNRRRHPISRSLATVMNLTLAVSKDSLSHLEIAIQDDGFRQRDPGFSHQVHC